MSRVAVGLLVLGALGCASAPRPKWVDDEVLKYDATKYPDDAAVVLYRADRTSLVEDGSAAWTRWERHEVTAVRGEAGFWLAEVKVPYRSSDTLLAFHARLLQPDGSRREFDAKGTLSDVSAKGDGQGSALFFRFPDVKVGSVLEYWYSLQRERFIMADEQDTLGQYPVRRYEFELTAAKPLVVETAVFNGATPIEAREWASGEHQLRFTLNDLPRREKVDFAPHWTFTEPRWAWRGVAYRNRSITYDWLRDWKDVVERTGQRFADPELSEGFDAKLDVAGCDDPACLVARARAFVVEKTSGDGVGWDRTAKLAAALASGKASNVERALMMHTLLQRAGVDAQLAYGTSKLGRQVSPSFPQLEQFDHLFVYLPVQAKLPRPMTIDPDCDFCAPGQLTTRFLGQRVFVFETKRTVLGAFVTEGRWETTVGEPALAALRRVVHLARVEADGVVSDEVSTFTFGSECERSAEDAKQQPKGLKGREQGHWRWASPLSEVSSSQHGECSRAKGKCEWTSKVRFPGQATKSADGWLVHLGFLNPTQLSVFDEATRELEVHFTGDDWAFDEQVVVVAPAGTKLANLPEPVRVVAGPLRVEVLVEPTANGARVSRKLERTADVVRVASYPDVRAAMDAFKRARQQVLLFK